MAASGKHDFLLGKGLTPPKHTLTLSGIICPIKPVYFLSQYWMQHFGFVEENGSSPRWREPLPLACQCDDTLLLLVTTITLRAQTNMEGLVCH